MRKRKKAGEMATAERDARLQDLLVKTSRTFALAIPQLPQPTLREVTIAYLLFRIADTFEDAGVLWDRPRRFAQVPAGARGSYPRSRKALGPIHRGSATTGGPNQRDAVRRPIRTPPDRCPP